MTASDERRRDLDRLYGLLAELRERLGGYKYLRDCNGRMSWPKRGVYFIFEDGELREDGHTPRVVRVGTHAVSAGSRTTLWNRLSQHREQPQHWVAAITAGRSSDCTLAPPCSHPDQVSSRWQARRGADGVRPTV